MSPEVRDAANALREFLFQNVYDVRAAREEAKRARDIIRLLYRYFNKNPDKLPEEFLSRGDSVERAAVDYIAGMTDQYALRMAEEIS
jgi:dGTPase